MAGEAALAELDFTNGTAVELRLRGLYSAEEDGAFQALLAEAIGRVAEIARPGPSQLNFLLHQAERSCLEPERIAALLAALHGRAEADAALGATWRAVARRQAFRAALADHRMAQPALVSLGLHCLPWKLLNRWGFRDRAQFTALHTPFSMALHKRDEVLRALATDFADYAEPSLMRESTTPSGQRIAMRQDGGAVWNHHRGPAWLEPDFAPLRRLLARRIASFRTACALPGAVFVMADCRIQDPAAPIPFLAPLRAALARLSGRPRPFLLLTSQSRRGGAARLDWLDAETAHLAAPYPHPHFIWADAASVDSEEGLGFEHFYAQGVLACLTAWGFFARGAAA
ncbi:DUF1796 family putative cysteine peptidase [Falsiroseomonas selenitidurans]|uniref:Uncharacterized protein n=1 Tax=Falsiroseomonas selenitidurans TaxID=2716335 RepID=A0ABX1E8L7_9PROT|nr:DUF1796 family putative cysteine peptidase [Falsiroseomonas selenitidurans]NKC33569.1 hypothetical protein [Falsiroseomonas selenitidurans]